MLKIVDELLAQAEKREANLVMTILGGSKEPRLLAMEVLSYGKNEITFPVFKTFLTHPDPEFRYQTIVCLSNFRLKKVIQWLKPRLKDSDHWVTQRAIYAIRELEEEGK